MAISPLYNTTYHIHYLSPLHVGSKRFTSLQLKQHATHIRDVLVGNVLRGVRVGLATSSDNLSRVGALVNVKWIYMQRQEGAGLDRLSNDDNDTLRLQLQLVYEKTTYTALFLQPSTMHQEEGWENYPLLLMRMPANLSTTIRSYLESTFDCSVVPLHLPAIHIVKTLETYLRDLLPAQSSLATRSRFEDNIKDIQLTLTIHLPSKNGTLKSIDITIPKHDILEFYKRGQQLSTHDETEKSETFMTAIRYYIKDRMALDMTHTAVQITKIACGGFVLGDGRIKIFPLNAQRNLSQEADIVDAEWNDMRERAHEHLIESLFELVESRKLQKDSGASPVL